LIHLARALIYNPEVIVVHTPGMYFDYEQRQLVVEVLQDFVKERGIEMEKATRRSRRLRTCIFTSDDTSHIDVADVIFECRDGSLKQIDHATARRTFRIYSKSISSDCEEAASEARGSIPQAISYKPDPRPVMQFSIAIYYAEKSEGMSL
jgi:hypothetical protein